MKYYNELRNNMVSVILQIEINLNIMKQKKEKKYYQRGKFFFVSIKFVYKK